MIYADYNGSAPLLPPVREYLKKRLDSDLFANPNAIHSISQKLARGIEKCRNVISETVGCYPDQIFFNSGASEGISHIFHSILDQAPTNKKIIITNTNDDLLFNNIYVSMRFFIIVLFFAFQAASAQQARVFSDYTTENEKKWVDSIYNNLSFDERVGQLFMVAAYSNKDSTHVKAIDKLVTDYKVGGLIFFQGGPVRQANLTNRFQSKAKVPLFIGIDAEWGLSMRLDSTYRYPWNMTLGAVQDIALIEKMGQQMAKQAKRMGIHFNFAPVLDVNANPLNPIIGNRSFGEDKFNVTERALALMRGIQSQGVFATGKHFPGHGDTSVDSHLELPVDGSVQRGYAVAQADIFGVWSTWEDVELTTASPSVSPPRLSRLAAPGQKRAYPRSLPREYARAPWVCPTSASLRPFAPSLARMFWTWRMTVKGLIESASAISLSALLSEESRRRCAKISRIRKRCAFSLAPSPLCPHFQIASNPFCQSLANSRVWCSSSALPEPLPLGDAPPRREGPRRRGVRLRLHPGLDDLPPHLHRPDRVPGQPGAGRAAGVPHRGGDHRRPGRDRCRRAGVFGGTAHGLAGRGRRGDRAADGTEPLAGAACPALRGIRHRVVGVPA